MRKTAYSAIILLGSLSAAYAADPYGEWRVEDGVATIRVVDCNGHLWGVVASEKTPGGVDRNNPDKAKQSRPTLGMPVLLDMKKSAEEKDKWEGHIYNAKDGKTYEASIQPTSATQLKVEGCVLGFLCGGQTWTRVPDSAAAAGAPKAGATTAATPTAPPKVTPTGAPKVAGQKSAPGAPTSEVCLLPDIAGASH